MSQDQRPPLPKTAFNEWKLSLAGPADTPNATRPPNLKVAVIVNSPRIDVYTNVHGDKDNGRISAPMDAVTFMAVIVELEKIIDGVPDVQVKIGNKTGGPGQQRMLSTTLVGKDKEGRVYISLIAEGRPQIKFLFLPSDWHYLAHKDGAKFTEAETTLVYAKAWCRLMSALVPNVMDTYYTEPFRPNQGGGGDKSQGKQKTFNTSGYDKGGYSADGYKKENFNKPTPAPAPVGNDDFPM